MRLTAYGKTDVGLLRSNNEDSFFIDERFGLFIVADGMGGHAAGEVASQMAIESLRKTLEPGLEEKDSAKPFVPLLAEGFKQANQAIFKAATENPNWSGMGTTLTALLQEDLQVLLAHVGDSRLYRWRAKQLEQISEDQTLVADQLRRGVLDQAEAEQSNLRNILLQAVGISETLDIFQQSLSLQAGDSFLLCSDGLTGMLSDEEISSILTENSLPQAACEELLAAALTAGGQDNVTAVLVTVEPK